jgi:WD40 repeat protein
VHVVGSPAAADDADSQVTTLRFGVYDLSPAERLVAESSGAIRLWNLVTGECEQELAGHAREVLTLWLGPELAVSAGLDRVVRLWSLRTGQCLRTLRGHTDCVSSVIESYVKIGVDQGEANTKAQDLLKVIDARKLKPTKEQRAMVTAGAGLDKLNLWFDRALTAATAADIFKDDED